MMGLTARQKELFAFISRFMSEHDGQAPTFDQMAAAVGLMSIKPEIVSLLQLVLNPSDGCFHPSRTVPLVHVDQQNPIRMAFGHDPIFDAYSQNVFTAGKIADFFQRKAFQILSANQIPGHGSRLGVLAEASTSRSQILSRDQYAAVGVAKAVQLSECDALDLGQMLDVYCDQLPMTAARLAHPLSTQEGGTGYATAFGVSTVLHNEVDVVIVGYGHEGVPPVGSFGTRAGCFSSGVSA